MFGSLILQQLTSTKNNFIEPQVASFPAIRADHQNGYPPLPFGDFVPLFVQKDYSNQKYLEKHSDPKLLPRHQYNTSVIFFQTLNEHSVRFFFGLMKRQDWQLTLEPIPFNLKLAKLDLMLNAIASLLSVKKDELAIHHVVQDTVFVQILGTPKEVLKEIPHGVQLVSVLYERNVLDKNVYLEILKYCNLRTIRAFYCVNRYAHQLLKESAAQEKIWFPFVSLYRSYTDPYASQLAEQPHEELQSKPWHKIMQDQQLIYPLIEMGIDIQDTATALNNSSNYLLGQIIGLNESTVQTYRSTGFKPKAHNIFSKALWEALCSKFFVAFRRRSFFRISNTTFSKQSGLFPRPLYSFVKPKFQRFPPFATQGPISEMLNPFVLSTVLRPKLNPVLKTEQKKHQSGKTTLDKLKLFEILAKNLEQTSLAQALLEAKIKTKLLMKSNLHPSKKGQIEARAQSLKKFKKGPKTLTDIKEFLPCAKFISDYSDTGGAVDQLEEPVNLSWYQERSERGFHYIYRPDFEEEQFSKQIGSEIDWLEEVSELEPIFNSIRALLGENYSIQVNYTRNPQLETCFSIFRSSLQRQRHGNRTTFPFIPDEWMCLDSRINEVYLWYPFEENLGCVLEQGFERKDIHHVFFLAPNETGLWLYCKVVLGNIYELSKLSSQTCCKSSDFPPYFQNTFYTHHTVYDDSQQTFVIHNRFQALPVYLVLIESK